MRISDWSSDVCSSDLGNLGDALVAQGGNGDEARAMYRRAVELAQPYVDIKSDDAQALASSAWYLANLGQADAARELLARAEALGTERSEEHTSELQSLMRISYAVFCLKKKKEKPQHTDSSASSISYTLYIPYNNK